MKRKRFSVEQIVAVLKQAEVGVPVVEVCRQVGITEQTFYRWKKQFVGLEIDQVRQLKQLQEENGKLKKLVAERDLEMRLEIARLALHDRRGRERRVFQIFWSGQPTHLFVLAGRIRLEIDVH